MHEVLNNLNTVKNKVNEIIKKKQLKTFPKIVIVTKTFSSNKFMPLIESGHIDFGENKVQEAENKWYHLKEKFPSLQLHLIGKLQTNKAKKAVKIFDYIHSLDNAKLALKISQYEKEMNKKIKLFIQVNLAEENQKSGILLKDLSNFYDYCNNELSLNVIGLMCIPPIDSKSDDYFQKLRNTADQLNLKELSMGMSSDFENAITNGSTFLRLGSIILGQRTLAY
tara:strand:+ start:564 stop:1235 length:672 start_codon:yes stop_codon:yes gene_type:complete